MPRATHFPSLHGADDVRICVSKALLVLTIIIERILLLAPDALITPRTARNGRTTPLVEVLGERGLAHVGRTDDHRVVHDATVAQRATLLDEGALLLWG